MADYHFNGTYHVNRSSVGVAKGQSAVFQGVNNMTGRDTRAASRRGGKKQALPEDDVQTEASASLLDDDAQTFQGESLIFRSPGYMQERQDKMNECVENAATYELHSSLDPHRPKPDPVAKHYIELAPGKIREGYIIRIWKPDDVVMHLGTFAVLFQKGYSWATCKIIRYTPCTSDFDFRHYHAKVQVQNDDEEQTSSSALAPTGARLGPINVIKYETQGWHDNTWLNLDRSYDIGFTDSYAFTYCGKLTNKSKVYAKEKHKKLFFPM
ncbi:hypothetical protein GJ744_004344 [Endocarpon pusillum]|uniref:Uncharacterized protein n=1 Tax=Endocarpon pusillum TaxID=364733 RepID=A0A8H7A9E5_9EURO|nr:hypothetical protein GJ744_004344 [Endocarpon pusillum]